MTDPLPPPLPARSVRLRRASLAGGTVLLLLVLGFTLFGQTGRDDTYISYWPALTLAERGEILNYNLERVEQSSTLLWVLLLGAARWLTGMDMPAVGLTLSLAVAVALMLWLAGGRWGQTEGGGAVALLVATQPFFLYWAWSGTEGAMAALALVALAATWSSWLTDAPAGAVRLAGVVASSLTLVMVRPEGVFLAAAALLGLVAGALLGWGPRPAPWPRLGSLATVLAGAWALAAGFRWTYFGDLAPQPVTAKASGFSLARVGEGLDYLVQSGVLSLALLPLTLLLVVSLATQLARRGPDREGGEDSFARLAALLCLAQVSFAVAVGGDWMGNGRFLAPAVPLAAWLVVRQLRRWLVQPRRFRQALVVLVGLQLATVVQRAQEGSVGTDLLTRHQLAANPPAGVEIGDFGWGERSNLLRWREVPTVQFLEPLLERARSVLGRPPAVLSGQLGMVAYQLALRSPGGQRFLDRYALTSRELTECPLTRERPRGRHGLVLPTRHYLALAPQMEAACGIPQPDVIFDIFPVEGVPQVLFREGFVLAYEQRGALPVEPNGFRLAELRMEQFVAVRRELAEQLGLKETVRVRIGLE